MKRTFLQILILFLSISESFACICGGRNESFSKQIKRAFNQSDLVFTGKVIEINTVNKKELKSSADPIIYKFEISTIIKGKIQKRIIEVASEMSRVSCGYKFQLGKTYLVYSLKSKRFSKFTENEFDFATGLCSRNKILSTVKRKELRKLKRLNCKDEN
jgi:hypothetical protein